jgi:hypothetical protein
MANNFTLADRDKYLIQIEAQIKAKKNMLLSKHDVLEKTIKEKENHFLEGVKKDYKNYHKLIENQKKEELRVMGILKQYTDDLIRSSKTTEHEINRIKLEQREIMDEMKKIKKELDQVIRK